MKRFGLCMAAGLMLGLSACASTGGSGIARADKQVVDQQKVEIVNNWAMRRGINTYWVNLPTKRVRVDNGISN